MNLEEVNMERIEQLVTAHIEELATSSQSDGLQPDTPLDNIIDSTAIMELVLWIEQTFSFGVEIDDINADNFASIRQLSQWIAKSTTIHEVV